MWKRPSPFYWVTHQKYSEEELAALLGDLKVEKGSENPPCGRQCCGKGLFSHLCSQLAYPPRGRFHSQLHPLKTGEMCWCFFWDVGRGHCS